VHPTTSIPEGEIVKGRLEIEVSPR
jgi:hypothetical protein